MCVQHSLPAKNTRSQRNQSVLTPTERAPLYCTPSVHQLSASFPRGPPIEGEAPSRRGGMNSRRSSPTNKPLFLQAEPTFLRMMEHITQFMGRITQAASPRDNFKAPAFKTPAIKAPDSFDGTQAHKLSIFIQSCQLIFHNDPENFSSEKKKVLYSTLFLTGSTGKWIDPYLSNISNEDSSYLHNNWK
ncbi:hypothetical protein O181_011727 [Austropuccinia psidii MF-1]|uniref:DUF4939 domain-containing protein n=1 Tax=Austropuccinia psidii MF-1 TaxID=1389203 RepID=A0A9Q3BV30_9BASI|nr:hypothetical protein [Austropuccinia psidii MF-1]